MKTLSDLTLQDTHVFLAVFMRVSVIFSVVPIFGDRMVPSHLKILFSLLLTILSFPSLLQLQSMKTQDLDLWGGSMSQIALLVGQEVFLGLLLGFTAKMTFDGMTFGGNLMGSFMGFSSATLFDSHQESHTDVVAKFQTTLCLLIFLAIDGHHELIRSTVGSFQLIGVGQSVFRPSLAQHLIGVSGQIISFGVKIASPLSLSLLITHLSFGLIGKNMPQLNIFSLSTGISAILGFVVLYVILPDFNGLIVNAFEKMFADMIQIFQLTQPVEDINIG